MKKIVETGKGVRTAALILGMHVLMAGTGSMSLIAQDQPPGRSLQITPQIGVGYYTSYITDDAQTQRWALDIGARIGPESGLGLKVGYSYVPQASTTSSSAPRLHAVRALLGGSVELWPNSAVRAHGGVGGARVTVKPQHIDCGDFPLCSEWAPRRGSWTFPAVEIGAGAEVWRRVGWIVQLSLLIPRGDAWSIEGDPEALAAFTTGVSIRLGGGK